MNPVKWLSKIPCKSLNDNPRVQAEIRIKVLEKRRELISKIQGPRFFFSYSEGAVSSMRFGGLKRSKHLKAGKMIDQVNKEISGLQAFLNSF